MDRYIIQYLKNIGKAEQILSELLSDEIFDSLSKHDPFWSQETSIGGDRLHDLRFKLCYISNKISEVIDCLDVEDLETPYFGDN